MWFWGTEEATTIIKGTLKMQSQHPFEGEGACGGPVQQARKVRASDLTAEEGAGFSAAEWKVLDDELLPRLARVVYGSEASIRS